jgi:hypothetical protein
MFAKHHLLFIQVWSSKYITVVCNTFFLFHSNNAHTIMKRFATLLLTLDLVGQSLAQDCRERKEIRDMKPSEISDFIQAVKVLHERPSDRQGWSVWDQISSIHQEYFDDIHTTHSFFPW